MAPSPTDPEHLKLVALDADDLPVLSAHLQDAVVKVGDLAYLPAESRFALLVRRFDWASGEAEPRRCLSGICFNRVTRCRIRGIDRSDPDGALSLLAVTFENRDAPSGAATLVFAGGGAIELELECVEAQLTDLGPVWSAKGSPRHDLGQA